MLFGVVSGGLAHLFGEQDGERLGELSRDRECVVDEQSLEEGLVELSAQRGRRVAIRGFAVLDEGESFVEVGLSRSGVVVERVELLPG